MIEYIKMGFGIFLGKLLLGVIVAALLIVAIIAIEIMN